MAKKIIFKIGGNSIEDVRRIFTNPALAKNDVITIYVKNWDDVIEALSPERIHLLQATLDYLDKPADVNTLAKHVKRKQSAVSRDLSVLETQGLITKIKKGKNVYPKLSAKEIVIQLA